MPKAWVADNLRPDLPLSHAAALILRVKLPEVLHYEDAARAGKVEGIHDMRVACKRLREALRVLRPALDSDARRKLLPVVDELNDALGQVRDRDVLRLAFKQMVRADARLADLQSLRRQLARERRAAHRKLLRLLGEVKQSGLARRYEKLMQALEHQPAAEQPLVAEFAREAVGQRLQDVADNVHAITGRYRSDPFHRERIRVKKLKYALELVLPLLPRETGELYALVSDLQELMGLVHDVDVQRDIVADWAAAHGLSEGLRLTLQHNARERRSLLAQTRAHLKTMLDANFEGRLQQALRDVAESVAAPQAAG